VKQFFPNSSKFKSDVKNHNSIDCSPFFKTAIRANAFSPKFAIKSRKNGTVNYVFVSPFETYTNSEPSLKISSLHLILAYRAGTTLNQNETMTNALSSLELEP